MVSSSNCSRSHPRRCTCRRGHATNGPSSRRERPRLAKAINISDLRDCAKMRAHKMVFDYLDSGADDEISLRRGKDAYSELEMHYKILSGLKPPLDLRTKIFGKDVDLPFFWLSHGR